MWLNSILLVEFVNESLELFLNGTKGRCLTWAHVYKIQENRFFIFKDFADREHSETNRIGQNCFFTQKLNLLSDRLLIL